MKRLRHHSLLPLVILALVAPIARGDQGVHDAVAQIIAEADAGKGAGALVMTIADLGAVAAIECAKHLDPAGGQRNAVLLEVIARAAQSRRSNSELLKLYDPAAYRLYYTEDGKADQTMIGRALELATWPPKLAEAMVHAAPAPALAWMAGQAKSRRPRLPELMQVWRAWGFWARAGHERQYTSELAGAAASLAANGAILGDPQAWGALVRFAGEVRAESATGFIVDSLANGPAAVRAEAASACRRLATDVAAEAVSRAAKSETDAAVQQKIAMAAEAWPARPEMGVAMMGLFDRADIAPVRREILYSCSRATWAERGALLSRGLDLGGDAAGAALSALAVRAEPRIFEKVLELSAATQAAQPPLIDALAAYADARATPHLLRWVAKEENPVVRVKLLLALERTAKGEADALFLKLLTGDASAMVVEQCIGIAARRRIEGAAAALVPLALDPTAPVQVRIEAIRAMGRFDMPDVRKALATLDADAEAQFKTETGAANTEAVDMARMMVALAKLQLGDADGPAKLQRAFDRGTGMARLTALVMLAQTGLDHPIIGQGLATNDTAIIFGATRAAAAADARKYHARLVAIRTAPFVQALLSSGLDAANLGATLDEAIEKGGAR